MCGLYRLLVSLPMALIRDYCFLHFGFMSLRLLSCLSPLGEVTTFRSFCTTYTIFFRGLHSLQRDAQKTFGQW
ncbi:hypothetical protein SAMN05660710_03240 [Paracoccus tibetensis]|uniref:Uncharacterized protein n=1 Tax=Paracoccus tibetensis TaxID=336292 RepID=A0A1G5JJ13_9RHOB|nr:hypothetical protein SAMN05660710_03240 [Paracoccus tibetensis]